ncbi:MAG TPA: acetate/propionate family kinase [Thermoanaerobaculia bacterium]|nr:acetate/propionate family kinase [Thermoanaerobaculia bacterium]
MSPRWNRALVLNAGSSTLKWSVLERDGERLVDSGTAAWESAEPARRQEQIGALWRAAPAVDVAGHRVVHGGADFRRAVLITAAVRANLARLVEIDPLHAPAALAGIAAVAEANPRLPQVAAFDTSFHATLPEAAALYPLPREWSERFGLRRYGFHGLSVGYAVRRVAELAGAAAGRPELPGRLVVCHLGSGCSLTAVAGGRSIDTTMGFTPLEGVMMANRSGSVDPGLLLHLEQRCDIAPAALAAGLNQRSGLAGVSGLTGDFRELLAAADAGHARATLAYAMFVHSLCRAAGAMIAVLGGLDALVVTGGIGEHSPRLRADLAGALAYAGLRLDPAGNAAAVGDHGGNGRHAEADPDSKADTDLSASGAAARFFVVTAREDLAVLREIETVLAS